ncbi:hypothetical protein D3C78_1788710 [compost metagenome]
MVVGPQCGGERRLLLAAVVLVAVVVLGVERVEVSGGGHDFDVVDGGFDFQLDTP